MDQIDAAARALHTALTKYAALARPLGRSGAADCRADVNANIPQYRCVFLRRRGIPDRLNWFQRSDARNTKENEIHPSPSAPRMAKARNAKAFRPAP